MLGRQDFQDGDGGWQPRDLTEQEIRTRYITPAITGAGWPLESIREEHRLTEGQIVAAMNGSVTNIDVNGFTINPSNGDLYWTLTAAADVPTPLDIPGESVGGFVPPRSVLLQRFHYDPVQLAPQQMA